MLHIAGHIITECEEGTVWNIIGVFTNERLAKEACYNKDCFISPIQLNEQFPKNPLNKSNTYFPNQSKQQYYSPERVNQIMDESYDKGVEEGKLMVTESRVEA